MVGLPFQNGRWRWYDTLGYTWVGDEPWGWLPYHYGRWTRKNDLGWVWVPPAVPGTSAIFKPGDVYWLRGAKFAAWGPLAPGENWSPAAVPEQFLNVNTTYAAFAQDAQVIDPEGFTDRPRMPLLVSAFALALPSPAFPASRLEAVRPVLRVGYTRVNAVIPGTTFQDPNDVPPPPQQPPMPPITDAPPARSSAPPPDPGPPGPPMQVIYPVPVYTGIVVLNPPEHPDYSRPNPNNAPAPTRTATTTAPPPAVPTPKPAPTPTPTLTPAPPRVNPLPPISRPTITPSNPPPPATKPDASPKPKTDPTPVPAPPRVNPLPPVSRPSETAPKPEPPKAATPKSDDKKL